MSVKKKRTSEYVSLTPTWEHNQAEQGKDKASSVEIETMPPS